MILSRIAGCFSVALLLFGSAMMVHSPAVAENGLRVMTVQASPVKIPPEQLKSFASAAKQVFKIREKYAPKVQSAGNEDAARTLITAAQGEMRKAIEGSGLTIDRYNEIIKAAQADPALASKIQGMIDKPK